MLTVLLEEACDELEMARSHLSVAIEDCHNAGMNPVGLKAGLAAIERMIEGINHRLTDLEDWQPR